MEKFRPTHEIYLTDRRDGARTCIEVCAPDIPGPAYTREEWEDMDPADWEIDANLIFSFQGRTAPEAWQGVSVRKVRTSHGGPMEKSKVEITATLEGDRIEAVITALDIEIRRSFPLQSPTSDKPTDQIAYTLERAIETALGAFVRSGIPLEKSASHASWLIWSAAEETNFDPMLLSQGITRAY